jgi:hypothetical protein
MTTWQSASAWRRQEVGGGDAATWLGVALKTCREPERSSFCVLRDRQPWLSLLLLLLLTCWPD